MLPHLQMVHSVCQCFFEASSCKEMVIFLMNERVLLSKYIRFYIHNMQDRIKTIIIAWIVHYNLWTGIRALFESGKSSLGLILTISAQMPVYMYWSGIRALFVSIWDFFLKTVQTTQNKGYSKTLILECSLWEHSDASANDQCTNARLGVQVWHSRADREHLS